MAKQNPGRVLATAAQNSKTEVENAKLKGVVVEETAADVAAAPVLDAAMLASAESIFAADASPVLVAQVGDSAGLLGGSSISTGTLLAVGAGVLAVGGVVALASSGDDNDDNNNTPVTPTPVAQTITVTGSPAAISEGGTAVTYSITTTGYAAGQAISYSITGVSADDINKDLSGLVTLDANGTAVFTVSANNDALVEGAETLSFATSAGTVKGNVVTTTVNDTTPPPANDLLLTVGEDGSGAGVLLTTAGDDVIRAPVVQNNNGDSVQTLESVDTVDGLGGNDTLIATLAGGVTAATVRSVETIEFRSAGVGPSVYDFAATSGLKSLTVTKSTAFFGGDNLSTSGVTSLTVSDNVGGVALEEADSLTGATISGNSGGVDIEGATSLASVTVSKNSVGVDIDDVEALTTATISGNTADVHFDGAEVLNTISVSNQNADVLAHDLDVKSLALNFTKFGTTKVTANLDLSQTGATATTATAVIATDSSFVDITGDTLFTAVTVAATGASQLSADSLAGTTKSVTVTGTGSLDLVDTLTVATSLDASGNSGGVEASIDNTTKAVVVKGSSGADDFTVGTTVTKSSISTGAGNDQVTVTTALGDSTTVSLGDGNDRFDFAAATATKSTVSGDAGDDTLVIADKSAGFTLIDGGTGTDIINLTTGLATAANLKAIETLDFSGAVGPQTYDLSVLQADKTAFTRVQANQDLAGDVTGVITLSGAAATQSVFYSNAVDTAFTAGGLTVNQAATVGTKADVFNLDVTTTDVTSKLDPVTGDPVGTAEDVTFTDAVTLTGYETVNLATHVVTPDANLADGETYDVVLAGSITSDATRLNITGNADVIDVGAVTMTALARVDATGATGDITIDLTSAVQAVRYDGSSGVDTVVASGSGDNVFGGASNDDFTLAGGKDTVIYRGGASAASQTEVTLTKAGLIDLTVAGNFETLHDFTSGGDQIQLEGFGYAGTVAGAAVQGALVDADGATAGTQIASQIANFFQVAGGGNRGAVFVNDVDGATDYLFVDTNKDGNFTANTDLVVAIDNGAGLIVATDIVFLG